MISPLFSASRSIRAWTNINNTLWIVYPCICQQSKRLTVNLSEVSEVSYASWTIEQQIHRFTTPLTCFYLSPSDGREWNKSFSHAAIFSKFSAASVFRIYTRSLGWLLISLFSTKHACAEHASKLSYYARAPFSSSPCRFRACIFQYFLLLYYVHQITANYINSLIDRIIMQIHKCKSTSREKRRKTRTVWN